MFQRISNLSKYFEKLALHSISLFHGTDAGNIRNIINQGLLAQQPNGAFSKNIYLTPDIETAALYSSPSGHNRFSKPIILEITISGQKRVNRLSEDYMDQPYQAAGEGASQDINDFYDEDIYYLKRKIEDILEEIGLHKGYSRDFPQSMEHLNGFNIYKKILEIARGADIDIQKTKNAIKKYLPLDTAFQYIEIKPDGTLKPTEDYYKALHQMEYPKDLPSRTIKAVWIPKNNVNPLFQKLAIGQAEFGERILAPEIGSLKTEIWNNLHYQDDIESIKQNIQRIDVHNLIDLSNDTEDIDNFKFDIEEQLYDLDWGKEVNKQIWFKFSTETFPDLRNVENLYTTSSST